MLNEDTSNLVAINMEPASEELMTSVCGEIEQTQPLDEEGKALNTITY